jgi:glycosyltransferase involved in cell wall biosynthesis
MLDQVTPVILTRDEAPNIAQALERLRWAQEIVVVDSFSKDETVSIARTFPQVRIFQRRFDGLANQWNYALRETGIRTEWILALDADYVLADGFVEELQALSPNPQTAGYRCRFTYCVHGRALRGSLYPPVTVLFRRGQAFYRQDGHAHRVVLDGATAQLRARIHHDDRKSLNHWLVTQDAYMILEAEKLARTAWVNLSWPDRLRKLLVVAPVLVFLYSVFVKRVALDGRAGLHYAVQRTLAETLLALRLLERSLR